MALDSRQKRAAVIGVGRPWYRNADPNGLDAAQRASIGNVYPVAIFQDIIAEENPFGVIGRIDDTPVAARGVIDTRALAVNGIIDDTPLTVAGRFNNGETVGGPF